MAVNVSMGENEANIAQPSNVYDKEFRGMEIFIELGVLSESELKKIVDDVPNTKALKLEAHQLPDQVGEITSYYLVSLEGMSCSQIHSMRRVKIFTTVGTSHEEVLLSASKQLTLGHGTNVWKHYANLQRAQNPTHLRDGAGYQNILTIQDIIMRAESLKEKNKVGHPSLESSALGDDQSESEEETTGKVVQAVSTNRSSRLAKQAAEKKGKKAQGRPKSKSARAGADDISDAAVVDVESLPNELKIVVEALKAAPKCFAGLDPARILAGEKLMRSVEGVWGSGWMTEKFKG